MVGRVPPPTYLRALSEISVRAAHPRRVGYGRSSGGGVTTTTPIARGVDVTSSVQLPPSPPGRERPSATSRTLATCGVSDGRAAAHFNA